MRSVAHGFVAIVTAFCLAWGADEAVAQKYVHDTPPVQCPINFRPEIWTIRSLSSAVQRRTPAGAAYADVRGVLCLNQQSVRVGNRLLPLFRIDEGQASIALISPYAPRPISFPLSSVTQFPDGSPLSEACRAAGRAEGYIPRNNQNFPQSHVAAYRVEGIVPGHHNAAELLFAARVSFIIDDSAPSGIPMSDGPGYYGFDAARVPGSLSGTVCSRVAETFRETRE